MTRTSIMPTSAAADALPLTISAAAARLRDGPLTAVALLEKVTARAAKLDAAIGVTCSGGGWTTGAARAPPW
jgi:hypothetical protein